MINKNRLSVFLRLILIFILWLNIVHGEENNPKNLLVLPMPKGLKIEFVPVCVNTNSSFFDWKKIKLGDSSAGFKEYPTAMALGGSFPIEQNGKKMWCYYMGKYELSKQQYLSIMSPENVLPKNQKGYPITNISWFDAIKFTNLYNQWLFDNAKDKIPKFDISYGFLRLPTEVEWEFAARGGSIVSDDFFDQKTPYIDNNIQSYEWFGGPTSSHYKLQPIGLLKPNPLGLHDMLGNADEMTMSLYSVEYYQGKIGGFVSKGNNYNTSKNKLHSASRREEPFYHIQNDNQTITPHTKSTLGFRLVISALVFPSNNIIKEMSNEWDGYRGSQLGATMPAVLSTSPTSVQTSAESKDAFTYLNRLKDRLKQKGIKDMEIENSLGNLDNSIHDMVNIYLKAEKDSSYLWIKVVSEQARFIRKENQKLPTIDLLIKISIQQKNQQKIEIYETRKKEHITNISGTLSAYTDSIRQISTLSSQAVKEGFIRYLNFLMNYNDAEQVKVLNIVQKHLDEYQKNKRANSKQWEKDINF